MDAKAALDATSTEESLSALSTQLVSLGYLSRPLDLSTLFLAPALPSQPSAKALKRHHDLLVLQARAREQIAKCLWGMLDQRQSEREVMEGLLAGEAKAADDADREHKARERAEREREGIARDLEAERAKTKELEVKLKAEQERHRHAREELGKTKNALQFVKTQATHDLKRRETEVQSLHQRLQKLTSAPSSSDSAYTRFATLNSPSASSPNASPLSATFGGVNAGRASRPGGRTPTPTSTSNQARHGSPSSAVLEAELDLVRTSLDECLSARAALEGECADLRAFVGEVGEWAEGMLEVPELVASYLVPTPHLALPVGALTSPLHRKLYAIRLGLLSLSSASSSALSALREELEHEIERLHEEVEEEQKRREEVEGERDDARDQVNAGEKVVKEWAERAEKEAQRAKQDESDDDLPPEIEASLALDKQKRLARKAAKHAPLSSASTAAPAPSTVAAAARPSIPSAHVSAFLSELGLDTPGLPSSSSSSDAPREKAPLKADKVSITSARERDLAQSQRDRDRDREGKRERVRPSIARPAAAGRERERDGEAEREADKGKARDEREGAMLPPPNPVRRTSSSSRTAAPPTRKVAVTVSAPTPPPQKAASAVQDILALADSPPTVSEPLVSSRVLGSSRAVNSAPPTSSAAADNEDRVRAKRAALLAAARSSRAAT
ncbi:uncharacterized protein RHOBADRAFT_43663 [Rhodotorula graminis WP1]|uniref:Proteophosphoglycan ppg4 n=1 Tax=Rhodotorula graminis (strain WP1) TaxID=578459 RepID=A0A194S6Y4_RHOGW|nr:uncharacterized protein RHOBADRAFT_43663 [Rhodotorula graminis WP1]KPV75176.1 hypothetical protein RHOBADRAFT_43663 [Rhodotorula graminis WP1]